MGNVPAAVAEGTRRATGATAAHAATEHPSPVSILSRLAGRTRSFSPAPGSAPPRRAGVRRSPGAPGLPEMVVVPEVPPQPRLLHQPTYSPNLNLIERLWKFVKKQVLNAKYYENFATFKTAISGCIADAPTKHKEELDSLLTLRFQTFDKAQLLAA